MKSLHEAAVAYHMYPLGMTGAPEINDGSSAPVSRLSELKDWIPHLRKLHVHAVNLGPVFESSSHGYDTVDYRTVDRRLGTDTDLEEFITACHESDILVLLDGVFNHTGRKFFAFEDLRIHGESSSYEQWYTGVNFSAHSSEGDPFSYDCWNGYGSLPRLNLENPDVKRYIFLLVGEWIQRFGIDGLRLDAADCIGTSFREELAEFCRSEKHDFILLSEIIHGDYNPWISNRELDSVTNYEVYKGLWSSLNDRNLFEIAYSLNRQFGPQGVYRNSHLYNFADNHDVDRISSKLSDAKKIYPLYCILFTIPGIPSLYYGSEFGIQGKRAPDHDREIRSRIQIKKLGEKQNDLMTAVSRLAAVREGSPALKTGDYRELYKNHEQLVFSRTLDTETVIVFINASDKDLSLSVEIQAGSGSCHDLLNGEVLPPSTDGRLSCRLFPNWARIFRITNI